METRASTQHQRASKAYAFACSRINAAWPTICVYIVAFLAVVVCFGTEYTLITAPAVCIFQNRQHLENTLVSCIHTFVLVLVLTALAWAATHNLILCILLNITVPFVLVIAQSNQYLPKAHFGYAMTFVFMQLVPLSLSTFFIQLQANALSMAVVVCALALWQIWREHKDTSDIVDASLEELAGLLERMAQGERSEDLVQSFIGLERTFDRLRITRHHFLRTPDKREYVYTMYALLFQRAVYFLSDDEWHDELDSTTGPAVANELARLVRQARVASQPHEFASLARMAEMTLQVVELPESRMTIFFRSFLHMLVLILRLQAAPDSKRIHLPWTQICWRDVARDLKRHINFDAFEFRFACRLSVTVTITCTINYLFNFEHLYWLPLNAFLLLMPTFEESEYRMLRRPLGTVIGCLAVFFLDPVLRTTESVFIVSLTAISVLYCCKPGSAPMAVFATMFSVLMTSLTINTHTAIGLRILFVILAALLDAAVNRLVVPSPAGRVFAGDLSLLKEAVQAYWATVQRSITQSVSLSTSGEHLTRFHMIYSEARSFARGMTPGSERSWLEEHLLIIWHMFSEVEQVEYLVLSGRITQADLQRLARAATILKNRVNPTDSLGELKGIVNDLQSEELAYTLDHYLDNACRFAERRPFRIMDLEVHPAS